MTGAAYGQLTHLAIAEVYTDQATGRVTVRDSIQITPSVGAVWYQSFDLGYPEIRSVSVPLPAANGALDFTDYTGTRAISIEMLVLDHAYAQGDIDAIENFDSNWNSATWWVTQLAAWVQPGRKGLRLYYQLSGQTEPRWTDVVPAGFAAPISGKDAESRTVQMQFVSASGMVYGFDSSPTATLDGRSQMIVGTIDVDVPGISWPLTWPIEFPSNSSGFGSGIIQSLGTAPTPLVCEIRAGSEDLTDPRLVVRHFDAAGIEDYAPQSIGLRGYKIIAGQFMTIDTRSREIYLGRDRSNRLSAYIGNATWPQLRPGRNTVGLVATAAGADAAAVVTWTDAYTA